MRNWWEQYPVADDRLNAKPTQDLAAEVGVDIPPQTGNWWEQYPEAKAVPEAAPTLPYPAGAAGTAPSLEPTPPQFRARSAEENAKRDTLLDAEAAAKGGISLFTGLPDLVVSAPILARNLTDQMLPDIISGGVDRPWSEDLFPLTNAAFDSAGAIRDAIGIPDVQPETIGEKAWYNTIEFGLGALDPANLVRGGAKLFGKTAPGAAIDNTIREAGEAMPEYLHNVNVQEVANTRAAGMPNRLAATAEQLKPTAAQLAGGAGAGLGFTAADEGLPDGTPESIKAVVNPIAAFVGQFLGPKAGRALVEPFNVADSIKRDMTKERRIGKVSGQVGGSAFPTYPTQDEFEKAARIFQGRAVDLPAARSTLDRNLEAAAGDQVKNTTAQLSEDIGLLRDERAARLDPNSENEFLARNRALAEQDAADFEKLAPPERGNKGATAETIVGQVDDVRTRGNQAVEDAKAKLAQREKEAKELSVNAQIASQKNVGRKEAAVEEASTNAATVAEQNKTTAQELAATPRLDRESASTALVTDVLEPAKKTQRTQYKEKIEKFENDAETQVDAAPGIPELETVMDELNAKVNMGSFDGQIRESMRQLVRLDEEGQVAEHSLSPKELLALEQRVAAGARDAKAQGNGAAAKAFSGIRAAIDDILEEGGLGAEFQDARKFYRENIAEPFVHDTSGRVLRPGARGEQYKDPLSESIPAYFQKGAKSGASMDQLLKAGGKDKVVPLVRDYVVDDMFKQFYNQNTSEFNTKGMRKYIADRPEAFDRIPEVRNELHQMLNKLDEGSSLSDMAETGVKEAKQKLRESKVAETRYLATREKALSESVRLMRQKVSKAETTAADTLRAEERSAARFFLKNEDPVVAVAQAFGDKGNLVKNLRELKNRVDKDTSGKAAMGLREAIYDHIEDKVIKHNRQTPVSGAQLEKIEKQYTDALVESGIWSKEDAKVLETIRRRIDASRLSQEVRALPGESSTAENVGLSDRHKAITRSIFRLLFGGFQGGTVHSAYKDALKLYGSGKKARRIDEIVRRFRMDPEAGRLALKQNLTRYEESVYRARLAAIITKRTSLVETETLEKDDEKK